MRKVRPGVVKVGVIDGDHYADQLAYDAALVVSVLSECLLLGLDEVKRGGLPTGSVKVLRPALGLALGRIGVRGVHSGSVLADDPEAGTAPAGECAFVPVNPHGGGLPDIFSPILLRIITP